MSFSFEVNPRLLVDFSDEPKQVLEPINEIEQEPLVTLEEACESLQNILGTELELYIKVAKMNSKAPKSGLTPDESASIYLYTMEWNEAENSLYAALNQTFCSAEKSKFQPWLKYLKLFLTALFKLPLSECHTVWRGIAKDLSGFYHEGDQLTWWSLSSTTSSFEILQSPMYLGRANSQIVFSIETKNGRLIRDHSHLQQDDEILLLPGTTLKVLRSLHSADGTHLIHLRETDSSHSRFSQSFSLLQTTSTWSIDRDQYRNSRLEEQIRSSKFRGALSLGSMNLNDRDMEIVIKLAIEEKKCLGLDLRNNRITSVGAAILAQTFTSNNHLLSFVLDGNRICDSGIQSLALALKTNMMARRILHFNSTGITDTGCDYIAELLQENFAIWYLHLNDNQISDRGVRALCDTIRGRNCGLVILSLSGNKLITDASVDALCCAIAANVYWDQLFIRDCSLSMASKERLQLIARQRTEFIVHV